MAIAVVSIPKASAQIPIVPFLQSPSGISSDADSRIVSGWIYLDGYQVFQIAATKTNLSERSRNIQQNLNQIHQNYLRLPEPENNVETQTINGLPVIYVNGQYLMTVTTEDARLRRQEPVVSAMEIREQLKTALQRSSRERTTVILIKQAQIAGGIALLIIVLSGGVYYFQRRSKEHSKHPILPIADNAQQLTTQLNKQQDRDIQEVKKILFQLTQYGIWGGGIVFILGLFPYTRVFQLGILSAAQIPVRLGVVILGIYVATRFTYALIDRFTSTLISSGILLNSEASRRMELRVSTFSGVSKSIITGIWLGIGILLALISLGIDIVPLLAGAGLIGVALSLASQSLIKDAINGFLVIVEDQYALGDVIVVGDVGGLVENLNLRITQLRDAEGRLITIPNSEIKVVANLSSRWSRADLTIPVAYQNNIDDALHLLKQVASEMNHDPHWKRLILAPPEVLGIDNFGDRGLMIRVWIKTLPLKQWDVGREFRRRLKIAFDHAGFAIPVPQQGIWLNEGQLLHSEVNGKSE
ncbi:mechanosensitive ion channel family protein [Nodularia spumigena]|uniref:Mechanosensitive ion channel family protein n=1 Tax=Nodularia spumigena UHCC 0060 TaxID=3110300 RepID=A0ABU5UWR3_NODSP|nr:mechanosensitive ion channel family protein [Nodularia spumigena]MEA5524431.1 mechanosensitive ion channel family protein [Nodularia spumigena UHCC 0143]MEA5555870.1 mechanosensitive ion channel family protein [Nodularia spumigena CH309]MEA5610760.1 mechanosensitive ion channel family protein [Nodularia spumigena UHCC 0060]MEA5614116.1 mechanosensitive ion channel family protein [Nodularia spumigena UHCC 0040]